MAFKRPESFTFVAVYEDGSEATFRIDRYTLRGGDHVARIIAGEQQAKGNLPPGTIKEVRRAR